MSVQTQQQHQQHHQQQHPSQFHSFQTSSNFHATSMLANVSSISPRMLPFSQQQQQQLFQMQLPTVFPQFLQPNQLLQSQFTPDVFYGSINQQAPHFPHRSMLNTPQRTRYNCPHCTKTYARREHLSRHLRSHKSSSFWYTCSKCSKKFYRRDHLNYHLMSHNVCPRYICGQVGCPKMFEDKKDLVDHQSRCLHFGISYAQMDKDGKIVVEDEKKNRSNIDAQENSAQNNKNGENGERTKGKATPTRRKELVQADSHPSPSLIQSITPVPSSSCNPCTEASFASQPSTAPSTSSSSLLATKPKQKFTHKSITEKNSSSNRNSNCNSNCYRNCYSKANNIRSGDVCEHAETPIQQVQRQEVDTPHEEVSSLATNLKARSGKQNSSRNSNNSSSEKDEDISTSYQSRNHSDAKMLVNGFDDSVNLKKRHKHASTSDLKKMKVRQRRQRKNSLLNHRKGRGSNSKEGIHPILKEGEIFVQDDVHSCDYKDYCKPVEKFPVNQKQVSLSISSSKHQLLHQDATLSQNQTISQSFQQPRDVAPPPPPLMSVMDPNTPYQHQRHSQRQQLSTSVPIPHQQVGSSCFVPFSPFMPNTQPQQLPQLEYNQQQQKQVHMETTLSSSQVPQPMFQLPLLFQQQPPSPYYQQQLLQSLFLQQLQRQQNK
eukprot:m.22960 g.22960  ORF g.22960 m.22960 type:complete len:658 (+) comp5501_c0_seq1:234-2207(+)